MKVQENKDRGPMLDKVTFLAWPGRPHADLAAVEPGEFYLTLDDGRQVPLREHINSLEARIEKLEQAIVAMSTGQP